MTDHYYPELDARTRLARMIEEFDPRGGDEKIVKLSLSLDDAFFIRGVLIRERGFGEALMERTKRSCPDNELAQQRRERLQRNIDRLDRLIRKIF